MNTFLDILYYTHHVGTVLGLDLCFIRLTATTKIFYLLGVMYNLTTSNNFPVSIITHLYCTWKDPHASKLS